MTFVESPLNKAIEKPSFLIFTSIARVFCILYLLVFVTTTYMVGYNTYNLAGYYQSSVCILLPHLAAMSTHIFIRCHTVLVWTLLYSYNIYFVLVSLASSSFLFKMTFLRYPGLSFCTDSGLIPFLSSKYAMH